MLLFLGLIMIACAVVTVQTGGASSEDEDHTKVLGATVKYQEKEAKDDSK